MASPIETRRLQQQTPPPPPKLEAERRPDPSDAAKLFSGKMDVRSLALTGLFILAVFYTIYAAREVLQPIVFALLLSYLLAPAVRFLARLRVPSAVGAAVVIAATLGGGGFLVYRLSVPAIAWYQNESQQALRSIESRFFPFKGPMERVGEATATMEKIVSGSSEKPQVVEVKRPLSETPLGSTPHLLFSFLSTCILLYFLLVYGDVFSRKVVKALPRLADKKRAVEIAREIQMHVSTYLATITVINAALGVVVGMLMWMLGMKNPVLWGAIAALCNFVPYLGPMVAVIVLGLAAFVSFDGSVIKALLAPALFMGCHMLESYVVTPIVLGRRLTLNPVIIFVALIFWTWLWGIPGALLAVPLMAVFKIFCERIKPLAPIGEFLGE